MAELDHRVKNILANIGAIANRTSRRNLSVKEFVSALEGRIRAMASAHSLLSAARWEGADLRALFEEELAPFTSPTGHNVSLGSANVILRPKAAQSLALALHELVTNAAKHGALSVPEGRVDVSWHVDEADPPCLRILWQEMDGPRLAGSPQSKGFGLTVLQDMIAHDLDAKVACDFRPGGMVCTISIPMTQTVADRGEPDLAETAPPAAKSAGGGEAAPAHGDIARARRLLLVEDAWALGVQLKTILEVMGHEVVGPVTTVDEGMALADIENLDGAILDIRLDEDDVFPVAEKLQARQVPFGFATGYTDDHVIPARFRGVPRVSKPYSNGSIRELVSQLFSGGH
jgi:two-component sensor histidine kinase